MSLLWHVDLLGSGDDIESFAGYFARLARLHAVSPKALRNALWRWGTTTGLLKENPSIYDTKLSLPGVGSYKSDLSKAIELCELATGVQGLARGSLCSLTMLSRSGGIARQFPGWCPYCWRDDVRRGVSPYVRLRWCVNFVGRCHYHDVDLLIRCPQCQRRRGSLGLVTDSPKCQCGVDLSAVAAKHNAVSGYGEKDTLGLVDAVSRGQAKLVRSDPLGDFCRALHERDPELLSHLPKSKWLGDALLGPTIVRPTYRIALRLAYVTGVPVRDIICDPVTAACGAGQMFVDGKLIPRSPLAPTAGDRITRIESFLITALNKVDERLPDNLGQICRKHGVTKSFLLHHFPALLDKYQLRLRDEAARFYLAEAARIRSIAEADVDANGREMFFADLDASVKRVAQASGVSLQRSRTTVNAMKRLELSRSLTETFGQLVAESGLDRESLRLLKRVAGHLWLRAAFSIEYSEIVCVIDELSDIRDVARVDVRHMLNRLRVVYCAYGQRSKHLSHQRKATGFATPWSALSDALVQGFDRFRPPIPSERALAAYLRCSKLSDFDRSLVSLYIGLGCPRKDIFWGLYEHGEIDQKNGRLKFAPSAHETLWEIPLGAKSMADFQGCRGRRFPSPRSLYGYLNSINRRLSRMAGSSQPAFGDHLGFEPFRIAFWRILSECRARHGVRQALSTWTWIARLQRPSCREVWSAAEEALQLWHRLLSSK